MPVKSIELRTYVHATEEKERVLQALKSIIGGEEWRDSELVEERYEGHYGNPVTVLTVRVEDAERATRILKSIVSRLPRPDAMILLDTLEDRVDGAGNLYLRLSKQDAYLGKLALYEADDVVRVTVGYQGRRSRALEEYRGILEESGR